MDILSNNRNNTNRNNNNRNNNNRNNGNNENNNYRDYLNRKYLCEIMHLFNKYLYICEKIRPNGWTKDPKIRK